MGLDLRQLENGDFRVTQAGDQRITEAYAFASLDVTLADVVVSAAAELPIVGTLAASVSISIAATAQAKASGRLAASLDAVSFASTARARVSPSLYSTLASISVVSAGRARVGGSATPTLASVGLAAGGTIKIKGAVAPTLAAVQSAATGTVKLAATFGFDYRVTENGDFRITEQGDTRAAPLALNDVTLSSLCLTIKYGDLAGTLDAVSLQSTGTVQIKASEASTYGDATLAARGTVVGRIARIRGAASDAPAFGVAITDFPVYSITAEAA